VKTDERYGGLREVAYFCDMRGNTRKIVKQIVVIRLTRRDRLGNMQLNDLNDLFVLEWSDEQSRNSAEEQVGPKAKGSRSTAAANRGSPTATRAADPESAGY
jgi:hypothetical protein